MEFNAAKDRAIVPQIDVKAEFLQKALGINAGLSLLT
jgi:hypothetical protein